MQSASKQSSLGTLGLPLGEHWVRFHVEADTIFYERAEPPFGPPAGNDETPTPPAAARAFVEKWSGQGRLLDESETGDDPRLAALTAKHLH